MSSIVIDVPDNFSFRATVYSHGWCQLKPFSLDEENWRLDYVFADAEGAPVSASMYEEAGRLRIDLNRAVADPMAIIAQVRHILRLDEDLSGFYAAIEKTERLRWVSERRAGRLLRSPTVFEDLVKTICTTNCSWGLTKSMVSNLVEKLGASEPRVPPSELGVPPSGGPSSAIVESNGGKSRLKARHKTGKESRLKAGLKTAKEGRLKAGLQTAGLKTAGLQTAGLQTAGLQTAGLRAFPTAEAMASVGAEFYRNEVRAGYRSPYFVELAESVASGRLDPEGWLTSDLPTPELKKEMKKVKGVGDYAAENLLKLVGRYDGLALDSWLRSQFYKYHNGEKACPDKKIERHYTKYGKWRGLAIWCDMTEKWISRIVRL